MHRFLIALTLVAASAFASEGHKQCPRMKDSTAMPDTAMCCKKKHAECPRMKDSTGMDSAQCAKHMEQCKKHDPKQCPKKGE